jgi:hypothetical protein
VKDRGLMLMRKRTSSEQLVKVFRVTFNRLGWAARTVKVQQYGKRFFLNVGALRGLDPQAAMNALQVLPDKCGARRIMAALVKLPEQVATDEPAREAIS